MPQPAAPTPDKGSPAVPRGFYRGLVILLLALGFPLFELLSFSLHSALFSHIALIPCISLYFVWQERARLPGLSAPHVPLAAFFITTGIAFFVAYVAARIGGFNATPPDVHALSTLSFLCFLAGLCAWQLGAAMLRKLAFPLAFLLFMVPFPVFLESAIETVLQHGSAAVAHPLFKIAGTPVFVDGLSFQLPGITLQVAPECSGIHSTLALFITSIVTGRFILRTHSRRLILTLAVLPLALLRNGFRVFVIGELCVHISPSMIDSYIHRQGGPIFFALSLIPFFLLLVLLIRSERKISGKTDPAKS